MSERGLLIVVEGIDRCGKGTLTERLAASLPAKRIKFPRYEVEPIGPLVSRILKKDCIGFDWLDHADRSVMFQALCTADRTAAGLDINVHRLGGRHVVLDRSWPSAYAYGSYDGLDPEWLSQFTAAEYQQQHPDVMLLLDLSPEVAMARRDQSLPLERYDGVKQAQEQCRQRYLHLWMNMMRDDGNPVDWFILDAKLSPDTLLTQAKEIINARLVKNAR